MKTTFYIIATFLGLQSNLIFANGISAQTFYPNSFAYEFSDNDLSTTSVPSAIMLAPVVPQEANFDDSDTENLNFLLPELAPKTPGEADFLDTEIMPARENKQLAPMIPLEATFDDLV